VTRRVLDGDTYCLGRFGLSEAQCTHVSSYEENRREWAAPGRSRLGVGFRASPLDGFSVQMVEYAEERIVEATRACCEALLPFCAQGCNIYRYINAAAMTCPLVQRESPDAFSSSRCLSPTPPGWLEIRLHRVHSRQETEQGEGFRCHGVSAAEHLEDHPARAAGDGRVTSTLFCSPANHALRV
jgi:hypothetical protein